MPTENEKKWIAAWKFAGPELERIRNEELRQTTDEEHERSATMLGVPIELIPVCESQIGQLNFWFKKLSSREAQTLKND